MLKKAINWTARTVGAVAGARIGSQITNPLAAKALDQVGIASRVPAGLKAFAQDASIALHAVGGFCVGNVAGEWVGKKIG